MFFFWDGPMKLFVNGTVSGIEAAVADHFIILLRDMLDKAGDEIHDRKGFFNILVIFVPVIVEGDEVTVITVDSGGGNNGPPKIAPDIFKNFFWITLIRFGIDIKAMLMVTVTLGLDGFERGSDTGFHLIEEGGTERITEKGIVILVNEINCQIPMRPIFVGY